MASWNGNTLYGRAMMDAVYGIIPTFGNIHVVLSTSDNQNPAYQALANIMTTDNDGRVRFWTSLEDCLTYGVVSNNNDVVLLDGDATHTVSTMLTLSLSRVNFIGMDGGGRVTQQGAKIQFISDLNPAVAALLKVTGTRNSFRNIKFIQNSTNAAALNVVQAAGEGTLYEDCSFIFSTAANLDLTTASELLLGEDSGTFRRCSFGTDVLLTSAARSVITLDAITGASSSDGAKSNRFIDCETVIMSSSATALHIKLADTAGAKFLNEFINQRLMTVKNQTNSAIVMTNGIASAAGFVEGSIVFVNPLGANLTNLCSGVTDNVVVIGPAVSAQAGEGVTPS